MVIVQYDRLGKTNSIRNYYSSIWFLFSDYHDYNSYDKYLKLEQIKMYDFWYLITLNYRYISIYCNLNVESIKL